MSSFTFLTDAQCFGEDKLDIIKKREIKAAITDFSILLGGWVTRDISYWHIDGDSSLEERSGYYWTKTDDGRGRNNVYVVRPDGLRSYDSVNVRSYGVRPALLLSSISSIPTNGVSGAPKMERDGVLEVEYGYYPQKAVSRDMQEKLERAFQGKSLSRTGNKYTTDSRK